MNLVGTTRGCRHRAADGAARYERRDHTAAPFDYLNCGSWVSRAPFVCWPVSPFVGQPKSPGVGNFARATLISGVVVLVGVFQADAYVVGQPGAAGSEQSRLRNGSEHPSGPRVVERGERPYTEDPRRIAELDLPGLGPGADIPRRSPKVSRTNGPIVFSDERKSQQAESGVRGDAGYIRALRASLHFRKGRCQAIGIKDRVDIVDTDIERQEVAFLNITNGGAPVFEAFSPLFVIGGAVVEIDPRIEPMTPDAQLRIILLGLEDFHGQRAGKRQRLFQPGRNRGARRDAERDNSSACLQVDGKH